jgi:hypothetical protein
MTMKKRNRAARRLGKKERERIVSDFLKHVYPEPTEMIEVKFNVGRTIHIRNVRVDTSDSVSDVTIYGYHIIAVDDTDMSMEEIPHTSYVHDIERERRHKIYNWERGCFDMAFLMKDCKYFQMEEAIIVLHKARVNSAKYKFIWTFEDNMFDANMLFHNLKQFSWKDPTYMKSGHQVVGFIYGFSRRGNDMLTRFRDLWDTMINGHKKTVANSEGSSSSTQESSLSNGSDVDNRWPFPIDVNCIPGGCNGDSLTTSHIEQIINGDDEGNDNDRLHYWIFWVEAMCAAARLNLQFMFMVDELQGNV